MKPNPFRVALKTLGVGVMAVGAILWLLGIALSASTAWGGGIVGFGATLMAIGWLPFIAWLIVGALQHVPEPLDRADELKSEAEITAWVKEQKAAREKS